MVVPRHITKGECEVGVVAGTEEASHATPVVSCFSTGIQTVDILKYIVCLTDVGKAPCAIAYRHHFGLQVVLRHIGREVIVESLPHKERTMSGTCSVAGEQRRIETVHEGTHLVFGLPELLVGELIVGLLIEEIATCQEYCECYNTYIFCLFHILTF